MSAGRAVLGVLLVGVLAAFVLLVRSYARAVAFPGSPLALPGDLGRLVPGARLVAVPTSDGLALTGAWVVPQSAKGTAPGDSPAVLYFHGNAESAASNLPFAAELAARGIPCFLAEYRGFGGQPGHPTEAGLKRDAEAAFRALLGLGTPPERVVIVGRSLGTAVATALAAEHPPAALILVSPFTSAVDMGRSIVGPLAPLLVPDRLDNVAALAAVRGPVTIFHGSRDEVVPFWMGKKLAASRAGTRFVPLDGLGHNDIPTLGALVAREVEEVASGRRK